MRDLRCFQLLLDQRYDDDELPAMLEALSKRTARQRAAFFGPLLELLWSEDPKAKALHAHALTCIGDGDGHLLVEVIVAALTNSETRVEAVSALRQIALRQPSRWVHAMFHPDAQVRTLALAELAPGDAADFEIFALADPASRDIVLARNPRCSAESIGAVLAFLEQGILTPDRVRELLRDRDAIITWVKGARTREVKTFDADILSKDADDLDTLIDLFWDDAKNGPLFFNALAEDTDVYARFIASLLVVAKKRGGWSKPGLTSLFMLAPEMIGWTFVPEHVRRNAIEWTLELTTFARRSVTTATQPLFFHAMCLHPDGGADLRVCTALMLVSNTGEGARELGHWIGEKNLTDAITARPAQSAPYFQLLDKDDVYKREVYFNLTAATRSPLVTAFVRRAPEATLGFLAHVGSARLHEGLAELVNQELPSTRARRLAEIAAAKLDSLLLNDLFFRWHPRLPASEDNPTTQLGFALLFAAGRILDTDRFVATMTHTARTLPVVLGVIDENPSFPYGKEVALANALRTSPDPYVRRWAIARTPHRADPTVRAMPPSDEALARVLVTCKLVDLAKLVEPFLHGGRRGLARALSHRTDNPNPDARICAALIASVDPVEAIDEQLVRYGSPSDDFLRVIEHDLASSPITGQLSLLGHAALWRWEKHGKVFIERALDAYGDLPSIVKAMTALTWSTSRRIGIQALADAIGVMSSRDKPRAATLITSALVDALIDALKTDAALWVADALLATWRHDAKLLAPAESRVRFLLVDLDDPTREKLGGWIDAIGLPSKPVAPRRSPEEDRITIARVRASTNIAELGRFCTDTRAEIVQEAALRLIEIGEDGRSELARLLEESTEIAHSGPIAESISLWDDGPGPALVRVRHVARDPSRPPHVRYAVAIALVERGEILARHIVVECLLLPTEKTWFRPEDWTRLTKRLGFDAMELAVDIAASPQPHAYVAAVQHLIDHGEGETCNAALRAFLDEGTQRMGSLRRSAAQYLHARGDLHAFAIVLEHELEASKGASTLLVGAPAKLVKTTTLSFLAAGNGIAKEATLLFHLAPSGVDFMAKDEAHEMILVHCASDPIRQRAALAIRSGLRHLNKLIRVAETFAWGARMGQELLGKLYRVQMTGGKSLGHTFLTERKIHVTPLPILRGDRHGREIVEALILHEFGHHLYHRGKDGMAVWKKSEEEGLQGLLNLVADEHLERNLRALDPSFGDRLKRLAAYAFQHTDRELVVRQLLSHLGAHAFGVLTQTSMRVARDPLRIIIESGALLYSMEKDAMAFSRFMRALRMGLGNRHDDPLVEKALALFDGNFRHKTMRELMDITYKLRDIFGWQVELVKSIGPHETLEESPKSDDIIWGEGITQEEVDRMVERVLDPKSQQGPPPREGAASRPVINISPKNDFERITLIERVPFDASQHRDYARKVQRPATMMRRYLDQLGMHHVNQTMRLRGSRFDKSRTLPMIIRGEPRVLIQREIEQRTDLFIGIVIDCSGSMASRDNMERARQFGMLLAEACSGVSGVDLRVFGFTDRVIYDCGDARRCSAYALNASGGNNDAAALFHAANVAKTSRRRAKLLVMISDGLPTECTVAALRELVSTLGRRHGMVCAQVAVQPLAEICFPHYVVCNDPTIEQTVMRFGKVVMNLVSRAIKM